MHAQLSSGPASSNTKLVAICSPAVTYKISGGSPSETTACTAKGNLDAVNIGSAYDHHPLVSEHHAAMAAAHTAHTLIHLKI